MTKGNEQNVLFIKGNDKYKKLIIVSFGGCALKMGGIQPFEFVNTLNKICQTAAKYFVIDKNNLWYHGGIKTISNDVNSTVEYLKNIIDGYEKVIFIGTSAGGYASILFGSLLNVDTVLAFIPQTIISNKGRRNKNSFLNKEYINLNSHINDNTNYILYGDPLIKNINSLHHISHCNNIKNFKNVNIIEICNLDMKVLRNSGKLDEILMSITNQ
jgi:hypothetical protein